MEQPKPVYIEVPAPKPPCRDNAAWTHEPQYDYFLNVNMCRPVGVDRKDIKCSLNFRKQFKLSEVYEKPATPKGIYTTTTTTTKHLTKRKSALV